MQWGLILSKKQLLQELYVISWVYTLLLFTKLDRLYIKDGQKLIWSLNVSSFPTTNWPDVDKRTEFSLKLESFVIRYSCSICVLSWHWNLIPRHIKYLNFEHQNQSTDVLDVPVQLAKQEAMLICQIIHKKGSNMANMIERCKSATWFSKYKSQELPVSAPSCQSQSSHNKTLHLKPLFTYGVISCFLHSY